jgi:hypothetical protein
MGHGLCIRYVLVQTMRVVLYAMDIQRRIHMQEIQTFTGNAACGHLFHQEQCLLLDLCLLFLATLVSAA